MPVVGSHGLGRGNCNFRGRLGVRMVFCLPGSPRLCGGGVALPTSVSEISVEMQHRNHYDSLDAHWARRAVIRCKQGGSKHISSCGVISWMSLCYQSVFVLFEEL